MLKKIFIIFIISITPAIADQKEFVLLYETLHEALLNPEELEEYPNIFEKVHEASTTIEKQYDINDQQVLLKYAELYYENYTGLPGVSIYMAKELYKEYFRILEKSKTPYDQEYFNHYLNYIATLALIPDKKGYANQIKDAFEIAEAVDANSNQVAYINIILSKFYSRVRSKKNARKYFEKAIEIVESDNSNKTYFKEILYGELADILHERGNYEQTIKYALEAMNLIESQKDIQQNLAKKTSYMLSIALLMNNQPLQAANQYQKYTKIDKPKLVKPVITGHLIYPERAARSNIEGWVEFIFDINENGYPENIRIQNSSRKIFEGNAKDALERYRYIPLLENGKLIPIKDVELKLEFKIG